MSCPIVEVFGAVMRATAIISSFLIQKLGSCLATPPMIRSWATTLASWFERAHAITGRKNRVGTVSESNVSRAVNSGDDGGGSSASL